MSLSCLARDGFRARSNDLTTDSAHPDLSFVGTNQGLVGDLLESVGGLPEPVDGLLESVGGGL
jgi:hypothetical protein